MADIGVGVVGLGRMGMLHALHLKGAIQGARLVIAAVDPTHRAALEASGSAPCRVIDSVDELVSHPEVEAVVIASSSNVHDDHIVAAAEAGKPIFSEKPLADSVEKAEDAVQAVRRAGVPFQIGFQRRFDPGYARARELIRDGRVGEPELFRGITSDHIPPIDYLRTSGGLFWDLGVHDFDAARFLMDDEVTEVHATGMIKVAPELAEFGDIDYGVVLLRFLKGGLGVVQNSWRAPWGYEIRAEVCGSQGRVVTELDEMVPTWLYQPEGFIAERHHQFLERFQDAYRVELQAFIDAMRTGRQPSPDGRDGLKALQISDAATRSHREDRWIALPE